MVTLRPQRESQTVPQGAATWYLLSLKSSDGDGDGTSSGGDGDGDSGGDGDNGDGRRIYGHSCDLYLFADMWP